MSLASVQLLRAAATGDLDRLRTLLVQGVAVNSTNKANQTALMLAAGFKRLEIVECLVLAGADVNVKDELGFTAADWARGDIRITRLLKAQPVSVAHQNSQQAATLGGVAGAIQRDHTSVNSAFAAAVALETTAIAGEKPETDSEEEIRLPQVQPMSPAMRTLVRVSILVLLIVGSFGAYHFVTSIFSNRTSTSVKTEPASAPVNAATKPAKAAPAVGGALAGAELFVPDAPYPADATVASANVAVAIQVSRKGIVVKAEALDNDESLSRAAEKAALSSAFAPEKLVDKGELIAGTITYNFVKPDDRKPEFGLITDSANNVSTGSNVSAAVGGPLAGAERNLAIPKIPKWVTVEQPSATVVVRVNRSGRVMSYRPLDAEGSVRNYLIKAVRASTFDPKKLPTDGQVVGTITYKFQ